MAAVFGLCGTVQAQHSYSFPLEVSVGSTSLAQAVPVTIQTAGTLQSIKVLTGGAPNLDFSATGGTCSTGTAYIAGQTCTVSVSLAAKYPGVRTGAVLLLDGSGNALGTELLYGIGSGPLSVLTAGEITTIAGNGNLTIGSQTSSAATDAAIHEPVGVAVDGAGDVYFTDNGNNRIGRVDTAGNLTIVAGGGGFGYSPNNTPATSALLNGPSAIIVDGAGNIYFTDVYNNVVREIVQATGLIETVAGNGTQAYTGDGGLATSATLNQPQGIAMDAANNLYIADTGNNVIRKVSALDGTISTFAGDGAAGFSGDGGPALAAQLDQPYGIAFDTTGNLFIADFINNRIRRVDTTHLITTVAGSGGPYNNGDGAAATSASMDHPASVAVDAAGDVFIGDSENNVVRKVNGLTQIITTLAGNGTSLSIGDGMNADNPGVSLDKVYGIALDGSGDLFVADRLGLRVRKISATLAVIQYKDIKQTNTSPPVSQQIDNDGNATLQLSSITPVSNAAIDPASTTCSTSGNMSPGVHCVIGAEFKPTVVGSPVNGSIVVASNSPNSPVTIDLTGNSLSIEPTTTTLTSSLNPSSVGGAVTFTATVSSLASSITGTVQFLDGTTLLGGTTQNLNLTSHTAQLTTTSLALGSHSITAVYSGDNSNQTSTSTPALIQVVKQSTSLALTSNDNPARVYDPITFTVTANELPTGGATPTGSIVFSSDGTPLANGTIALANGVAQYTTALLTAGKHQITATYAGDLNNLAGTSNILSETVNLATTTTTLSTSNASVLPTVPVTFTAQVTGISSSIPTGNVVFKDGAATLATVALTNTGTASFVTSTLATGTHSITAVYQGDADYGTSSSAALTETVNKIATSAAIASSANPADAGAAVQFTITITGQNSTSPNIAITGQVKVMEGTTILATGTLVAQGTGPATATVTIPVSSLATGAHGITAVYAGDANYLTSTSSALLETIQLSTSSTVLTVSATSTIATKPLTLSAKVTSNGGTPGGSVNFMDGTVLIGGANLNNGLASLTTTALAVGTHTITAVYQGDAKDGTSTSNAVTVTVVAASTAVKLTPSQNPTSFGQPFTLTAAVTGNGGTPTGNITFIDGTTPLQSVAVNANGIATYTTSTLSDGTHSFTASYGGDANDGSSISPALSVAVLQTVNLSLTSTSPNPSIARSNVHFVATITALQGIQPTGSITFKDGATTLGTGLINGTKATFDTAALAVGTHSIVAFYNGDASTQSFSSAPYLQTITAAGATVTVTSSANPATFGALLTFTANATSAAGPLTGTVNFEDGGVTIGSGALSSTGVATFSTTTLTPGNHSIVAAYLGDANDQPAASSTLQQVVERATSVTLTSSQNPLLTLAPVTITATVANGGTPVATGTLTFSQDGVVVSTVPVGASGTATLQVASLPTGTHSFVASYSGDAIDLASTSPALSEVVQLRATIDVLTSSASSLTGGQQITLISVLHWTGSATPTGSVTFFTGTSTLATAPVDPTGVATVTVLLTGTSASLSSSYSGDASYAASTSAPDLVTIGPAQNFEMTATPGTFTLATKQYQVMTVRIASVKDYTDTLSLGCLGLPLAATCTFSSDQMVLPAGGIQTVTLTVDTGNPLLAGQQSRNYAPNNLNDIHNTGSKLALACLLPGGLLFGLLGFRFRRLRGVGGLLLLLCLAGISTALTGCGTVSMTSTPAGTYSFNVTATGRTGISQSLPITMTVTQ